jgi:hypothetical protein
LNNLKDTPEVLPLKEDDIVIYKPNCTPICREWEECIDDNYCIISQGRCEVDEDCNNDNSSCDFQTHYCNEPSSLYNGDFDIWADNTPDGYLIGDALKTYKEENKKQSSLYSVKLERIDNLKTDNTSVEFLSPPVSVEYLKNYQLSLYVLENNYNIDAKIYYKAYDVYNEVIGSGIAGGNDFTINEDNWIKLSYKTNFISEIWRGPIENLSYIRFGLRLYKAHCDTDNTCPPNYEPDGNGYLYLDSLKIEESN